MKIIDYNFDVFSFTNVTDNITLFDETVGEVYHILNHFFKDNYDYLRAKYETNTEVDNAIKYMFIKNRKYYTEIKKAIDIDFNPLETSKTTTTSDTITTDNTTNTISTTQNSTTNNTSLEHDENTDSNFRYTDDVNGYVATEKQTSITDSNVMSNETTNNATSNTQNNNIINGHDNTLTTSTSYDISNIDDLVDKMINSKKINLYSIIIEDAKNVLCYPLYDFD